MHIPFFQVDAFSDVPFKGNPAAVCPLSAWLPDDYMQKMAAEHNLSETAFIVPNASGYDIRWFTPKVEVDLCGHATLAAAHVIFHELGYEKNVLNLHSPRSGPLSVRKESDYLFLNFPADSDIQKLDSLEGLQEGLGIVPVEIFRARTDILVVVESEGILRAISPDFGKLNTIDARGVIVTAKGEKYDFVSRFFAPQAGVNEDPVTGSAHTTLIPYWAKQSGKKSLHAKQLSERGGELLCKDLGDRVEIGGKTCLYSKGEIRLSANS